MIHEKWKLIGPKSFSRTWLRASPTISYIFSLKLDICHSPNRYERKKISSLIVLYFFSPMWTHASAPAIPFPVAPKRWCRQPWWPPTPLYAGSQQGSAGHPRHRPSTVQAARAAHALDPANPPWLLILLALRMPPWGGGAAAPRWPLGLRFQGPHERSMAILLW
jgi:hypothetical protein